MSWPGYNFPYTESGALNMDWVLNELQKFKERLDGSLQEAVDRANAYTNMQLQQFKDDFAALQQQINQALANLQVTNQQFIDTVNAKVSEIQAQVILLENTISANLAAAKKYTDSEIENNNDYILDQISQQLVGQQVINFFTGEKVTVQEMFDYLSLFHATNAITYDELAARNVTNDTLVGLQVTYTQIVTNGKNLIPQG